MPQRLVLAFSVGAGLDYRLREGDRLVLVAGGEFELSEGHLVTGTRRCIIGALFDQPLEFLPRGVWSAPGAKERHDPQLKIGVRRIDLAEITQDALGIINAIGVEVPVDQCAAETLIVREKVDELQEELFDASLIARCVERGHSQHLQADIALAVRGCLVEDGESLFGIGLAQPFGGKDHQGVGVFGIPGQRLVGEADGLVLLAELELDRGDGNKRSGIRLVDRVGLFGIPLGEIDLAGRQKDVGKMDPGRDVLCVVFGHRNEQFDRACKILLLLFNLGEFEKGADEIAIELEGVAELETGFGQFALFYVVQPALIVILRTFF